MKRKLSVTIDADVILWIDDLRGDRLSRSAAIETCILTFRQAIEDKEAAVVEAGP